MELGGITFRRTSKARMETVSSTHVSESSGVRNDYRGRKNESRRVTLLSALSWQDACRELGIDLHWTKRRANLLIEGIRFSAADIGRRLRIGPDVILEITQETTPCPRMDEIAEGLQEILRSDWRGGAACRVIRGGDIQIGDTVEWL